MRAKVQFVRSLCTARATVDLLVQTKNTRDLCIHIPEQHLISNLVRARLLQGAVAQLTLLQGGETTWNWEYEEVHFGENILQKNSGKQRELELQRSAVRLPHFAASLV